ncbi:YozD family protein [Rossellomorea vietnamensis]|uniref:YozD family protein n=1 Tax=Rossellomorea vietnamensis TaxID=218284 RepID=A0A5D4KH15_9BACI|nr:YozD family protein [Rossellomorea vietnamensis]TYR75553.1 YozD family protein [Rossellomorea vietnamensis]
MREYKDIYIDTDEIERYLYKSLISKGFVPGDVELKEIADSVFDFLAEKEVIEEG